MRHSVPSALALAALAACGTPTPPPTVTIEPARPTSVDDLVAHVDLADGQDAAFTWYRNGRAVPSIDGETVSASTTAKGETWRVEVVVSDDGHESEPGDASVTVGNAPPSATVVLDPSAPASGVDLHAVATGTDPDGDAVSFTYAWEKDGAGTSNTGDVLPGTATKRGQHWKVIVTPTDGEAEGEPVSAEADLANGVPRIRAAAFDPEPVTVAADAALALDVVDPDGDPITLTYAWTKNDAPAGTVAALPRGSFTRGDTLSVTVTASDPTSSAEPVIVGPVVVANAPPRADRVRLTPPVQAFEDTPLTCTPQDVADADGDDFTLAYAWKVNGAPIAATGATLQGADFDRDDVVVCVVTATDASGPGPAVASNPVTIKNAPPVLESVGFGTIAPGTGDPITLVLGPSHDADGDAITFTYQWYVESRPVSTDPQLDGSLYGLGDEIRCVVTPHDDREPGAAVSTPAGIVRNAPPIVTAVAFDPPVPNANTGVRALPTARDPNGDPIAYAFTWYVDGQKAFGVTGDTLGGGWFGRDAVITVDVTPRDDEDVGVAFRGGPVIAGNAAPTLAGAHLAPATIDETVSARCVPDGFDDPDGDGARYHYAWTVNGADAQLPTATLSGADYDKGDVIACTVIPDDGTDLGIGVTSPAVTVANAKPVLAKVTLLPTTAREATQLNATWQGLSDPDAVDAGSLYVTYKWYIDGVVVPGATTNSLTGASFDEGDLVHVIVTPNDGTSAGVGLASDFVTIANTPPKVTAVSFSPVSSTRPTVSDTITATPTVDDPDHGETYTFTYTWLVNGGVKKTGSDATLSGAFRRDDRVKVTVVANDGDGSGPSFTSTEIVVKDAAPGAPGVRLSPRWTSAGADDLRCTVAVPAVDPDGDVLGYTVTWKRNGATYPATGDLGPRTKALANDTVPAADVHDGETWTCSVVASDGQRTGPAGSATARAATFPLQSASAGTNFTCALEGGAPRCWGYNASGQARPPSGGVFERLASGQGATCGITTSGTLACWGDVTSPLAGTQWDSVDVGLAHACALDVNGTIGCWGNASGNALSKPSGNGYSSLSVNLLHSCVVDVSGTVKCWGGDNLYGENTSRSGYVQVAAGPDFTCGLTGTGTIDCWGNLAMIGTPPTGTYVDLQAGALHACAIDKSDHVTCWGDGTSVDLAVPTGTYASVSPGVLHTCATRTDGGLVCWGRGDEWQLDPPLEAFDAVTVGFSHGCGVDVADAVTCWGADPYGESDVPAALGPADQVTAGENHTCALGIDGSITCWGDDRLRQLRAPGTGVHDLVEAGRDHTCALDTDGHAVCWGDDAWGQSTVPAEEASTVFVDLALGEHHTCGLTLAGAVHCWGTGMASGAQGTETVPPAAAIFLDVAAGLSHTCGVLSDGSLDCWGDDFYGQSTPPAGNNFVAVTTGQAHSCALTTSGSIKCWGADTWGLRTPPSTGTYVAVEAGWTNTCALRSDGRTVCWGKLAR
jgi:alpha-tubulin suppressor-like RCC1 family protein